MVVVVVVVAAAAVVVVVVVITVTIHVIVDLRKHILCSIGTYTHGYLYGNFHTYSHNY
jgi:hypothetical protein